MIGKLKGKLIEISGNIGLIETAGGVGYQIFLTPSIISSHRLNQSVDYYTYLQVREDALILFGFETKKELDFFKLLLTVPGVGPKTAFSVISFGKVDEIISAIKENDVEYFSRIPGLGKKTAMKIMLELSQKMKQEFKLEKTYLSEEDKTVVDALIALGFRAQEAQAALKKIPQNLSIEDKIKEAIKTATQTTKR